LLSPFGFINNSKVGWKLGGVVGGLGDLSVSRPADLSAKRDRLSG
jgi:hypothetical protein